MSHCTSTLPITANEHHATALSARGVEGACACQLNVVTFQQNFSAFADQARSFYAAAVFHDPSLQAIERHGRQNNLSIRRLHRQPVVNQRRDGRWRGDNSRHRVAAFEIQRDGLTGGQRHGARLGNHNAFVLHMRRKQRDVAAQAGFQRTLVDHRPRRAVAIEGDVAGHEIIVADRVRCRHQTAHIDLRRG